METRKEQKKEKKEKKSLTEEQRQLRKKILVYPLMVLTFIGCMWLIFAPPFGEKGKDRQGDGFNTDMPHPGNSGIIGDKIKAYEQSLMEKRKQERGNMVGDLSSLWNADAADGPATVQEDCRLVQTGHSEAKADGNATGTRSSAAAYQKLNTSLGTFYEAPKEDRDKTELRKRIDELERLVVEQENQPATMEEQVALLEKSYELAAKYQNGNANQQPVQDKAAPPPPSERNGKAVAEPVGQARPVVVSALPQPLSDADFITAYAEERNYGFHTAIGTQDGPDRNTIAACIHGNQTVTDGQTVRLRLTEAMRISGRTVGRNTVVVGTAKLQGERLGIEISSLEHGGSIIPVELAVYDSDGQEGIFIPGSMEIDAAREIGANMGNSLGSSINISTDAGAQLASDLGKGVIQGVSQYVSKKMRTVKVHLKSGYRVLLYQERQQ